MYRHSITTALCAFALLGIATSACGDDEPVADAASATTARSDHSGHDTEVVIEGVDYAFRDVPASVPAGTEIGFRNTAADELHELVAFRLPDDEHRPIEELVALPPEKLEPMLGAPALVVLQPPEAPEPILAVGDGTLEEPGRYALLCFIPTGADPDEYMAAVAAAGGGAPDGVAGGPPHLVNGMFAELVVEPVDAPE